MPLIPPPALPLSSLYLTCLDLAIRSFQTEVNLASDVTRRADAFYDALVAATMPLTAKKERAS